MGTHEYDNNMRPDNEFLAGDFYFLVEGNRCRLLDGRRTTGTIDCIFDDSAMFRWQITKYEDNGKYWDLPFEDIKRFQFEKNSIRLDPATEKLYRQKADSVNERLLIPSEPNNKYKTLQLIKQKKESVMKWLKSESNFFRNNETFNFETKEGSEILAEDLKRYFVSESLYDIERKTAERIVLNPNSGEWIKGMEICLAEMGLVSFDGTIPRTKNIFQNMGAKKNRCDYLITRLAFVQAIFEIQNIYEVVLYRGMTTESDWMTRSKTLLSFTFNFDVADDFSSFKRESRFKTSYLLKITLPISKLLFTFFETKELNQQYLESEALILYDKVLQI